MRSPSSPQGLGYGAQQETPAAPDGLREWHDNCRDHNGADPDQSRGGCDPLNCCVFGFRDRPGMQESLMPLTGNV